MHDEIWELHLGNLFARKYHQMRQTRAGSPRSFCGQDNAAPHGVRSTDAYNKLSPSRQIDEAAGMRLPLPLRKMITDYCGIGIKRTSRGQKN